MNDEALGTKYKDTNITDAVTLSGLRGVQQ